MVNETKCCDQHAAATMCGVRLDAIRTKYCCNDCPFIKIPAPQPAAAESDTAGLVARLNDHAITLSGSGEFSAVLKADLAKAATALEQQAAEITQLTEIAADRTTAANELELRAERAEAALREIKELSSEFEIVRMAEAALKGES